MRLSFVFAGLLIPVFSPQTLLAQNSSVEDKAVEDKAVEDKAVEDKAAIVESIRGYLAAINNGNATLASSFWSETGEWTNSDGSTFRGRELISQALEESFANESESTQVVLKDIKVRFITSNVAIEDGTAIVSSTDSAPTESTYSVVHVRKGNNWLIDSIRETVVSSAPDNGNSNLKQLEWMVGTWVDQDGGSNIETNCEWTTNKNFLTRSFKISHDDHDEKLGTQIIGWDAQRSQIRSWLFDSKGGFGTGFWKRDGDRWIVDTEFQLSDGGIGTSTNIYTYVADSKFLFESVDRTLDGNPVPNKAVFTVIKINE